MNTSSLVKIVIPIYTTKINFFEEISLQRVCQILHSYPLVVIKPQSLDLSPILEKYPALTIENFADDYFRSIAGYNRLMLSEELNSSAIAAIESIVESYSSYIDT